MKPLDQIAFLDFYKRNNISPVSQDISDLEKHFSRRDALYRQCGIPPIFFHGRNVLEVGPGQGHNAVFTNYLQPNKYVLVDGNPASIQGTRNTLNMFFPDLSNIQIIESDFYNFRSDLTFDVVLCEATISLQNDPIGFLKKLSYFVKPSGILLITCHDHIAILGDILFKIIGRMIIGHEIVDDHEQVRKLKPFFEPILCQLKGMSRPIDDWIYDNIVHPYIGNLLSIEDAVKTLDDEFEAYYCSPQFTNDWRWYKDIHGSQRKYNSRMIDSYRSNIHNFLDFRNTFSPINPDDALFLKDQCQSIFKIAQDIDKSGINEEIVRNLNTILNELVIRVRKFSDTTAHSIQLFIIAINKFLAGKHLSFDHTPLDCWFGRGLQYISFIKIPE